jgi:ketosteroid isomerase-like protein
VSQENVDLVRAVMFPTGVDLVALTRSGELVDHLDLDGLTPDMEVAFATPSAGFTEYRGLEGFLEGWADWMMPWATYEIDLEDLLDAGDRVVALVMLRGQTAHDRVRIEQPGAAVFTIRDGKIARVEFHLDQREALEGAGLIGEL